MDTSRAAPIPTIIHTANPRALALYQRLGYRVISTAPYLDGVCEGVEDWVVDMEKALE